MAAEAASRTLAEVGRRRRRVTAAVGARRGGGGVELGGDVVERHEAFCRSLEPDSCSSLHHDLMNGRRMELEALRGEVVRRAAFVQRARRGDRNDVRLAPTVGHPERTRRSSSILLNGAKTCSGSRRPTGGLFVWLPLLYSAQAPS